LPDCCPGIARYDPIDTRSSGDNHCPLLSHQCPIVPHDVPLHPSNFVTFWGVGGLWLVGVVMCFGHSFVRDWQGVINGNYCILLVISNICAPSFWPHRAPPRKRRGRSGALYVTVPSILAGDHLPHHRPLLHEVPGNNGVKAGYGQHGPARSRSGNRRALCR